MQVRSVVASGLLVPATAGCAAIPPPLDALEQELARYRLVEDAPGKDSWQSWSAFVQNGGGDCEDWAAFSYHWLAERGFRPRLVIGSADQAYHVWVEVEVQAHNWAVSNGHVFWSMPGWTPLPQAAADFLADIKFGPGWPDTMGRGRGEALQPHRHAGNPQRVGSRGGQGQGDGE